MYATPHFVDRYDAGQRSRRRTSRLRHCSSAHRSWSTAGWRPVAARVAEELDAPLDIFVVRKLGVPGQDELAFGAIASGKARVLNGDVIRHFGITPHDIERVVADEERELERRAIAYRGRRHFPSARRRDCDRRRRRRRNGRLDARGHPRAAPAESARIIAAVPVASREALRLLSAEADACEAIIAPEPFYGVGLWYQDFSHVSDTEVRVLLADAQRRWQDAGPLNTHARV